MKPADIAAILGYAEKSPLLSIIIVFVLVFAMFITLRKVKVSEYKITMESNTKLHETLEKSYNDIKAENEDLRERLERYMDITTELQERIEGK